MNYWLRSVLLVQLKSAIDALEELGDAEIQRRRWNWNAQGEMSSFVEAVESLFDDSGLGDELEKGRSGLAAGTVATLTSLSTALENIDSNRSPNDIIDDPAMGTVRKLANDALRLLRSEASYRTSGVE
jgi:hypothetical protein